ncbi:unnamed protein product, partial [Meganyctiphanes norvegica]
MATAVSAGLVGPLLLRCIWCHEYGDTEQDRKTGALVGRFISLQHNVTGTVYALDEETLLIEKFTYDANGPDASFWIGKTGPIPNPKGNLVIYSRDGSRKGSILPAFSGEDVIVQLPLKARITEMSWFSVWCARFALDMGHVIVPNNLEVPRKRTLPEFSRLANGVRSGNITILDAKTFYIPNLHYDGLGPDAYFWVGTGGKPDQQGFKIPNEKGSLQAGCSNELVRPYDLDEGVFAFPVTLPPIPANVLNLWSIGFSNSYGHLKVIQDPRIWYASEETELVPCCLSQSTEPLSWYSSENTQIFLIVIECNTIFKFKKNSEVVMTLQ